MCRVVTLLFVAAHVGGALSVMACRTDGTPSASSANASSTPGPFRMAVWQSPGAGGDAALPPDRFTRAALIRLDRSGKPLPGLVRTWHTADRQTWTLTLHENLRLHSGEHLTSHDVRTRLVQMTKGWPQNPVWRDVEHVDTPTPLTLVVRLRRPASTFMEGLNGPSVAMPAGKYRLLKETPARRDFEAFDGYWNKEPAPSRVRVDFYVSQRGAWAAFLRNEADYVRNIPPASATLLSTHPDIRLCPPLYREVFMLGFRLGHPILQDVRVRTALNLAIDRQRIVEEVFAGYSVPVAGPFSPHYWAAIDAIEPWRYDPAAARDLLARAVGLRRAPLELVCLTSNQYPLVSDVAAAIEAQLQRVNVRLKIVALPVDELVGRLARGEFDVCVMPHRAGSTGLWPYMFWHSRQQPPYFLSEYASADSALDALHTARTPDEERAAVKRVLDVMRRDPPAAFIAAGPVLDGVRRASRPGHPDDGLLLPHLIQMESFRCGAY